MKRREAIKTISLAACGSALFAACVREARHASVSLENMTITGDEEALLAEVCETIIPETDMPGAKTLNIHHFVLKMVDDCHSPKEREDFLMGLRDLDTFSKQTVSKNFSNASEEDREKVLLSIDQAEPVLVEGKPSTLPVFYSLTKRHTIQGFAQSQYIMTEVLKHNMIPGRFDGCIEIKDPKDIQTILG